MTTLVKDVQLAWNALHGIINVYKPAGKKVLHIRNAILHNLCTDLNQLFGGELRRKVCIEPSEAAKYIVRTIADLSDNILAVGSRYQIKDIRCATVCNLGIHTSGVLLMGINDGLREAVKIQRNRPLRVYHVTGQFGRATENHFSDSRVTVKSTYYHINNEKLNSMISSLQASHQRRMFELFGVDIQTQTAYEIASKGMIRAADNNQPILFGIKVISYKKPEFVLEIHAINENELYLATLVHEIGIELKSVAHCTAIRCIRHGPFFVEDSLLRRHWDLNGILHNFNICKEILIENPKLLKQEIVLK